jgi:hypothetical protein
MIDPMKWRKMIAAGVVSGVLTFSGAAQAAAPQSDEDAATHDARTEGYAGKVQIDGSVAGTWIIFILVTIVSLSALFKDAKRSHLD